jgi:hypothetical protein
MLGNAQHRHLHLTSAHKGEQTMAKTAEYGLGPLTFPRGWFMIATAEEIADKPEPLRFFGRDMVLSRRKRQGLSG